MDEEESDLGGEVGLPLAPDGPRGLMTPECRRKLKVEGVPEGRVRSSTADQPKNNDRHV